MPLNSTARDALMSYLQTLPEAASYVFPSRKHTTEPVSPIGERALVYIIGKYAKRARVPDLSPHDLRHRFGYRMARTVPLHRLGSIYGPRKKDDSLDTTLRYVRSTKRDLQSKLFSLNRSRGHRQVVAALNGGASVRRGGTLGFPSWSNAVPVGSRPSTPTRPRWCFASACARWRAGAKGRPTGLRRWVAQAPVTTRSTAARRSAGSPRPRAEPRHGPAPVLLRGEPTPTPGRGDRHIRVAAGPLVGRGANACSGRGQPQHQ